MPKLGFRTGACVRMHMLHDISALGAGQPWACVARCASAASLHAHARPQSPAGQGLRPHPGLVV